MRRPGTVANAETFRMHGGDKHIANAIETNYHPISSDLSSFCHQLG